MRVDINDLLAYRIIHVNNLAYILQNGIYYRNSPHMDPNYINIGSPDIISRRDSVAVPMGGMLNDFVPFYLGMRSPMLLKIISGNGITRHNQSDIIYLCCQVQTLANEPTWCFTDGNATTYGVTTFYTDLEDINEIDWTAIYAERWSNGTDGDSDRTRKKQAEFLVKNHVPQHAICKIIVLTPAVQERVQQIVEQAGWQIPVEVDEKRKYYYYR